MKKTDRSTIPAIMALVALNVPLLAQAAETFDYPELMVTPRASERLELEAQKAQASRWTTHLSLQVPALTTFVAGLTQQVDPDKDPDKRSQLAGLVVGGGWLALTVGMALSDSPYLVASREIGSMPKKTTREQLTRERFAEEAIRKQARMINTIRWISVATNAGASAYMLSKTEGETFSTVMDAVSIAVAFTPLIFPHPWSDIAQEQEDYKKRIYAPVASGALLKEPGTARFVPGISLSLQF